MFNIMKNTRNNSLDLLRILSMFMVVILHVFGSSGLLRDTLVPGHYNWYIGHIMHTFSYQAVNCFILISGYFLCTAKFKLKKLLYIYIQVFFYSVIIAILVMTLISPPFSIKEFI